MRLGHREIPQKGTFESRSREEKMICKLTSRGGGARGQKESLVGNCKVKNEKRTKAGEKKKGDLEESRGAKNDQESPH